MCGAIWVPFLALVLVWAGTPAVGAGAAEPSAAGLSWKMPAYGYPHEMVKRFVVDPVGDKTFAVIDEKGREVFTGRLVRKSVITENCCGDFSAFQGGGCFRIRIGEHESPPFEVGAAACNAYREILTHSIVKGYNRHTRSDDGRRSDNQKWQDYTGGWHDAGGDNLKWTVSHAVSLYGMTEALLRRAMAFRPSLDDPAVAEAKYGFDWVLKLQEPAGYFGWGGEGNKSEGPDARGRTDGQPNTDDDRWFRVERNTLATQYLVIACLARMHRIMRPMDRAYADRCLAAAGAAYDYCLKHFDEMDAATYEEDRQAKYHSPGTGTRTDRLGNYVCGVLAGAELHEAAGRAAYLDFAALRAQDVMACQQTEWVGDRPAGRGWFHRTKEKDKAVAHELTSSLFLKALCDLALRRPDHPDAAKWKACVRMYVDNCVVPFAAENAWNVIPYACFAGATANQERNHGGWYHRYFKGKPEVSMTAGRNVVLCHLAAGMLRAADVLGDPELKAIAQSQVHWVLGANPRHIQIHGLTTRQGDLRFLIHAGMVENGPCGDERDHYNPKIGWWPADEIWMPNTGAFHLALAGMLPPVPEDAVPLGATNLGVQGPGKGPGPAFIVFTEQDVWTRFAAHPPQNKGRDRNSDHLVLISHDSREWRYWGYGSWYPFTPVRTDVILADVDMTRHTVSLLQGVNQRVHGIQKGYETGDLHTRANLFGDREAIGSHAVGGTYFRRWK
jgi:hypothetical protein